MIVCESVVVCVSSVRVCVVTCVCVCMCMCVCVLVCVCLCVCVVFVWVFVCLFGLYVCKFVCVCVFICITSVELLFSHVSPSLIVCVCVCGGGMGRTSKVQRSQLQSPQSTKHKIDGYFACSVGGEIYIS